MTMKKKHVLVWLDYPNFYLKRGLITCPRLNSLKSTDLIQLNNCLEKKLLLNNLLPFWCYKIQFFNNGYGLLISVF